MVCGDIKGEPCDETNKKKHESRCCFSGDMYPLLTGCGGQSSFMTCKRAMTKMNEKEASFEKEQGTLQSYEKKELANL
ncbi:hypothetical protein ACEQPO_11730 [Bacillus sp. SL00103]